jgi:hypothetical protein
LLVHSQEFALQFPGQVAFESRSDQEAVLRRRCHTDDVNRGLRGLSPHAAGDECAVTAVLMDMSAPGIHRVLDVPGHAREPGMGDGRIGHQARVIDADAHSSTVTAQRMLRVLTDLHPG